MNNRKYASGSSTIRTKKEEDLDYLERLLMADLDDDLYLQLKTLPRAVIIQLHNLIRSRIDVAHEQERRTILALHLCAHCERKVKGSTDEE
jgi:hypothetical protein